MKPRAKLGELLLNHIETSLGGMVSLNSKGTNKGCREFHFIFSRDTGFQKQCFERIFDVGLLGLTVEGKNLGGV